MALVPDFVFKLTEPEEVNSVERSRDDCCKRSFLNCVKRNILVVVPTVSSLMSTPSSSMRAVRPKRPPKETEEKPFFVGSKVPPS